MSDVLVIGAHGKIALIAQELLVRAGHQVTGAIRDPDQADDVRATGASPVVADVENLDTEALTEIVGAHDTVVWSAGAGGGAAERTYAVDRDAAQRTIDAAAAAGAARFVMVSYFGAGPDHGVDPDSDFFAYAEAKTAADAHLEASSLGWTILRPSTLTDGPAGGIDVSADDATEVTRATVAAVIAAVVEAPAATSRTIISFNGGDQDVVSAIA